MLCALTSCIWSLLMYKFKSATENYLCPRIQSITMRLRAHFRTGVLTTKSFLALPCQQTKTNFEKG